MKFLEDWKKYVMNRDDLSKDAKSKLMLSQQTLDGLKITGKNNFYTYSFLLFIIQSYIVYSFIEVVPYLLSLNGAKFIFSDRFNQDNVDIIWSTTT